MMEQIWTFIKSVSKGIVQGFGQFIDNDLKDYVPLFIIAAVLILFACLKKVIEKFRK